MVRGEEQRRALARHLNINFQRVHSFDHKTVAQNLLATRAHIDPQNICNKEDLKFIIHYMREFYQEKIKLLK